jgi:hypothetical protein
VSQDEGGSPPGVVDFDALHAALGDLPPAPTSSSPTIGESQGRSSATYASARPHTIPPTRAPDPDELNAPAVIVAKEDTVPTGPPQQMTVPMAGAPPFGASGPVSSRPHPAAGVRAPSPSHPFATQPFVADAAPRAPDAVVNMTVQMPTRPRRPRTPTIVVRTRGPTKQQKLLVFMAMLLVFVGGGIAFLIYGKRLGFNIDVRPSAPSRGTSVMSAGGGTSVAPTGAVPTGAVPTMTATIPTPTASASTTSTVQATAAPTSTAPTPSAKKNTRPRARAE